MSRKFLPALDQTLQPPVPNGTDSWANHDGGLGVLSKYSGSLAVAPMAVRPERLKSVPSPWARLLLFEQALMNKRHPAHQRVQSEWRGMMGVIGLAHHLKLPVTTKAIDLSMAQGVLKPLRQMAPSGDAPELWDRSALIYVAGQLVGGTSPRTLVYTGVRPITTGAIPFQEDGRLVDPLGHYRARNDTFSLTLLLEWLERLIDGFETEGHEALTAFLGRLPTGGASDAVSVNARGTASRAAIVLAALQSWRDEVKASVGTESSRDVVESVIASPIGASFPEGHPAKATYGHLIQIIPSPEAVGRNDLQVAGSDQVVDLGKSGILVREGHPFSGNVLLPSGMSRKASNGRFELATGARETGATLPDLATYFQRQLIPIRGLNEARGSAMLVDGVHYLYPLHPDILAHLPASALAEWVSVSGNRASGVRVSINVPLQSGLVASFSQQYASGDAFDAEEVVTPAVAAWPDFESHAWEHYFYVERRAGKTNSLELTPWSAAGSAPAIQFDQPDAGLRWTKLKRPAAAWRGAYKGVTGILLAKGLRKAPAGAAPWDVAVDFGSTHTRVFRSSTGVGGAAVTSEVEFKPRAQAILGDDRSLPYMFFVGPSDVAGSISEPPSLVWLPLDQVVTPDATGAWLPPDGVIFWGALEEAPSTVGLRGNLKWHRDDPHERAAFHAYVSQLYLSVAAEAASQGATIRSLVTAYPSVLPSQLRTRHRFEWRELESRFGVRVLPPRSEAEAVAAYFVDGGAAVTANLLAVDVGGSTSDIAVWAGDRYSYGDSIRLAGDILSRLVSRDAGAREAISAALQRAPFNRRPIAWDADDPTKNGMILSSVLRSVSTMPVFRQEPDVVAKNVFDGEGSPGERVIAYLGYLFGAVTFLVGLAARKHAPGQDRYDIRFAGKGSEYLHWLNALSTGGSTSLPTAFFRAGLGTTNEPVEVSITLPGAAVKQEVGRGLLLPALIDREPQDDRSTIVGDTGFPGPGGELGWDSTIDLATLRALKPPASAVSLDSLENLNLFIRTFDADPAGRKAARALGIGPSRLDHALRDRIHTRLFGPQSAWKATQSADGSVNAAALLEPFFITEAKALLEHVTGHNNLFAD